jgi:hypothetical protein
MYQCINQSIYKQASLDVPLLLFHLLLDGFLTQVGGISTDTTKTTNCCSDCVSERGSTMVSRTK